MNNRIKKLRKAECRYLRPNRHLLTSSLRHPKVFVEEFFNGFVTFHDHCSGEQLDVKQHKVTNSEAKNIQSMVFTGKKKRRSKPSLLAFLVIIFNTSYTECTVVWIVFNHCATTTIHHTQNSISVFCKVIRISVSTFTTFRVSVVET